MATTVNWSTSQNQGSAAHELGHATGLGHSAVGCAVMAPVSSATCGFTPSADDAAAMRAIY
ncbi:matrixin family metalloprotease [Branchiibius cervicis]|uniref:Matrixin family metalloprotease n=1 Tax=Branchiibius cervicis TaxID=908252 RepID=A0ABW2AVX7_9MICO